MSEDAAAREETALEESKPERGALVVLDADADERARVEGFAAQLERPVLAHAPSALEPASLESFATAAAVVVAWDLGGRPGIDWIAALARLQRSEPPRLALAASAATRPMVAAALRAGATAFLSRPYDCDELAALCEGLP